MFKAIAISGFLGFVLIFVGLVGFAWVYGTSSGRSVIQLKGTDMVLRRGEGYSEGAKLVVTNFDEQQRIRIISQQVSFRAEDMPFMAWTFSKFAPRTGVWVAWITKQDPSRLNMMSAILPYDSTAVYRMKDHPDWQGDIVALGFGFDRQMYDSFVLDSVEIRPYSIDSMLESMWDEWTAFEGWSLRSINLIKGGANEVIIRPLLVVFIWVIMASLFYQAHQFKNKKQWIWRSVIIFFIAGWIVLDVLWQINLFRQNYLSYHLYAGKTLHEKLLSGPDSKLYAFSQEVKKHLPDKKKRIFLTGQGLLGNIVYEQPRLQYFLMPYNVSYFENHYAVYSPSIEEYSYSYNIGYYVKGGDYVLVSGDDDRVVYDGENNEIVFGGLYGFAAERVYQSVYGALYRIVRRYKVK